MTTRKPHALNLMTLALKTLTESCMLGGLPSAIESFNHYQGSSRERRHNCSDERSQTSTLHLECLEPVRGHKAETSAPEAVRGSANQ